MPARNTPLVNGEIYHLFNRGNGSIPIFKSAYDYRKFIEIFLYYQNTNPPIRLSQFNNLLQDKKLQIEKELQIKKDFLVEILAYCLMPNHFHLLVKQIKDNGIYNFARKISDSYSHHFNIKNERKGSIFEGRFKATRVETNDQLLHISRYIHLNPHSSFLIKDIFSLKNYSFSSFPEYLGLTSNSHCQKEIILCQFKDIQSYQNFVFDQADYQRTLDQIKHQTFE